MKTVLMTFNILYIKMDRKRVKKSFNLQKDITFGRDSLVRRVIEPGPVLMNTLTETIVINVDWKCKTRQVMKRMKVIQKGKKR